MIARQDSLVSIVIPTRDRPEFLHRAIEAILAQDHPRLELIVVDDGSGPETAAVIERARQRDGRVLGLRQETAGGAAAARNAGAALAKGEFLLFEDDDCQSRPDRLRRMLEPLSSRPTAAYAYCRGLEERPGGDTRVLGLDGPWMVGTPAALIRAEVFRQSGGFDESLPRLQDFDLWTRLLAHRQAVEVPVVLYRTVREPGISTSVHSLVDAAARIRSKYDDAGFPPHHHAAMHRFIGGALMVRGQRRAAFRHLRIATAVHPGGVRNWVALGAWIFGPAAYRAMATLQARLGLQPRLGRRSTSPARAGSSAAPDPSSSHGEGRAAG